MRIAIHTNRRDVAARLDRDLAALPHVRVSILEERSEMADWAEIDSPSALVMLLDDTDGPSALDKLNAIKRVMGERGPAILALLMDKSDITPADALTAGARDVCRLEAHPAEFRNRVSLLLTLSETQIALRRERDGKQQQSIADPLTGLMNRPAFLNRLDAEIARAKRSGDPLVVGLMDLDRLKDINAKHGYGMGDRVLCAVSDHTSRMLREMDIAGRLGGTEFALCLPEVGLSSGATVLDRLRRRLADLVFPLPRGELSVTISIGVTELEPEDRDSSDLINRADRALLKAKDKGPGKLERL